MLAFACGLLAASSAEAADVTVCNKFGHPVFFAFAFEQGGQWASRGWAEVKSGDCRNNPLEMSKVDVNAFFFRGETNWIPTGGGKRTMHSWGKGREFAVQDKTFSFRDAEAKRGNRRMVTFSPSMKSESGSQQLTITIEADGLNTTQSLKRAGVAAPPPPVQSAPPPAPAAPSGPTATPMPR